MNPLAGLVRGHAADIIARFGTPVELTRATGAFDAAGQVSTPGAVTGRVPALLHRRSTREGGRTVSVMEVYVAARTLDAAGFPAPPRPGDMVTVNGASHPVVAVETSSVGAGAALYMLQVGR